MNRPRRLPALAPNLGFGALLLFGLPTCGDDTVYVRINISDIPQMTTRLVVRPFVDAVSYGEERFDLDTPSPLIVGFKLPPATRGSFRVEVEPQNQSGATIKTCDISHIGSSTVDIVEARSTLVDVKLSVTIPDSQINKDLNAVFSRAADDVWVAGAGGLIGHWNGCYWKSVPSQTTATLRGLHGFSSPQKELWAVGGDDPVVIVHATNDGSFQDESPNIPGKLYDLWGHLPTHLWAVGGDTASDGLIVKKMPGASTLWSRHSDTMLNMSSGSTAHFASIDGLAADRIYAVGTATATRCPASPPCVGSVAFFNGTGWQRPSIVDDGARNLQQVYAEATNRVWFGAPLGRLVEWGGDFSMPVTVSVYVPSGTFMRTQGLIGFTPIDSNGLFFTAVNDGMPGALYRHAEGASFPASVSGDRIDVETTTLSGLSATDLWIVGLGGVRYHFDGAKLKKYAAPM